MGKLLLVLCAVGLAGCFGMVEPELQKRSSPYLDCPAEHVVISDYERGAAGMYPSRWNASGCGRRFFCTSYTGGGFSGDAMSGRIECREVGGGRRSEAASARE